MGGTRGAGPGMAGELEDRASCGPHEQDRPSTGT